MSLSAQTLIVNLRNELGHIGSDWAPTTIETRNDWLTRLISELTDYDADELKILRNEHLNQTGKMAGIAALATTLLETLAWLKTAVTKREDEDTRLRTFLYTVTPPIKDDLRRELRNGEIRRTVAGQSQPERDKQFLLAAQEDKDEVLTAMLDNPLGPMVSDDMKRRALEARAQRLHPNDYAGFQQNTLLLNYVHMLQELIGRRLYAIGVDAAKIKTGLGATVTSAEQVRRPSVTAEQAVGAAK